MNFDHYLEPPLDSPGTAYVNTHATQFEQKLESLGRTAARLSGRKVKIEVDSYTDDNDAPLQDVTIRVAGLPMAETEDELLEVLKDLQSGIVEAQRKERKRLEHKAALARAEMEARQPA